MKIRMIVEMSGSRNGQPWPKRGQTVDLPTGEAQHLVDSGIAAKAGEDTAPVETATPPAAETSVPPKAKAAPKRAPRRKQSGE